MTASPFLATENPEFDLTQLTQIRPKRKTRDKSQNTGLVLIPLRELLVNQPPLAPNEKLPASIALLNGEPSLSEVPIVVSESVETADTVPYFYLSSIRLYCHPDHRSVYELVFDELVNNNFNTTHGTSLTLRRGCNGLLCRRHRAIQRFEAARLRAAKQLKLPYNLHTPQERVQRLIATAPQYASVEPLLLAMTWWAHSITPPSQPSNESKLLMQMSTPRALRSYLKTHFPNAIHTEA